MDERPPIWIGHAVLYVGDVGTSADFWAAVGMREIDRDENVAIMELRGGTHLVIVPGTPTPGQDAPFDLMVDDIAEMHARWKAAGLPVGEIEHGRIHDAFTLTDPDGYRVVVNSSHVVGAV